MRSCVYSEISQSISGVLRLCPSRFLRISSTASIRFLPLRVVQDNTYRIDLKTVAGLNLIAVGDLIAQANVPIKTQLSVGEVVDARLTFQKTLNKNRLKLRFLLLFAGFEQSCDLLPGHTLRICDTYSLFVSIANAAIYHCIRQRALFKRLQFSVGTWWERRRCLRRRSRSRAARLLWRLLRLRCWGCARASLRHRYWTTLLAGYRSRTTLLTGSGTWLLIWRLLACCRLYRSAHIASAARAINGMVNVKLTTIRAVHVLLALPFLFFIPLTLL